MAKGVKQAVSYEDLKDLFRLEVDENGNPTLHRRNLSNNTKWRLRGDWLIVNLQPTKSAKCSYVYVRIGGEIKRNVGVSNILYSLYHATDIPASRVIDHIDGNPSNNNLNNIKLTTQRLNGHNLKRHREGSPVGVSYCSRDGMWYPRIKIKGKSINLGGHKSLEVAQSRYFVALDLLDTLEGKSASQIKQIVLHYLATH